METKRYGTHVRDLHVRDVCIVPDEASQTYYMVAGTKRPGQIGPGVNLRESKDLVWWSDAEPIFEPYSSFWGSLDFWAPEIHFWRGKWYLVSSFRSPGGCRGCQFLEADSIKGPYTAKVNHPATPEDWHCLDGTLYEDRNGNPWMVFCHEWSQVQDGQMCAIRMKEDLSDSVGEPIILFRASEAPWKFTDDRALWNLTDPQPEIGWARITDGPYLYRAKNGELLMVWSSYSNTAYTCGYARSLSGEITGPWVQEPEPLFALDGGHSMLFRRFDGTLMMTLHSPNRQGKERALLFEMEDVNGHLRIINEKTGNFLIRYEEKDAQVQNMQAILKKRQAKQPEKPAEP